MPNVIAIDGRYIQDHFPGIGRYTFNLVDALARIAPADRFVVLHNPALKNSHYDIAALTRYPNVALQRVDVATFSWAEQFRLPTAFGGAQYALYHSPYFLKPFVLQVPSVVTIFDLIPLHFPNLSPLRARLLFGWLVALAARTATCVIAPSLSARDDIFARLRVPRTKLVAIPLGVDARFAPQSTIAVRQLRARYNLPPNYILYVGSNKPHKNLATLVKAWQPLKSKVSLVIAGAWDERYALVDDEQLTITHIRNAADADLPALYAGATAFVFPSLYEGFGLPPLEAMACGAPVICSNTSSLPEVVGEAAVLVNPRDVGEIANAIERVISNPALRDELRAKGLARAAQFSWKCTARATLKIYQTVAGKNE